MHNFNEKLICKSVYNVCINEGEGPIANEVPRQIIGGVASCDSKSVVTLRPQYGPDQ